MRVLPTMRILVENADNINSRFGYLNYMPHNSLRLVLNNRMHPSSSITNPKKKKKKRNTPRTIQKLNGITNQAQSINQLIPPITNLQPLHRRLITIFAIVDSTLIIPARFLLIILRRATGFRIGVTRRRRIAVIQSSTCGTVTCRRWCMGRCCLR